MVSTRRAGGGSGPQSVPGGPAKNAAPDGSNGGGKSVNAESFLALLAAKLQAQGKRDWQAPKVAAALKQAVAILPAGSSLRAHLEQDLEQSASRLLRELQRGAGAEAEHQGEKKPAKRAKKSSKGAPAATLAAGEGAAAGEAAAGQDAAATGATGEAGASTLLDRDLDQAVSAVMSAAQPSLEAAFPLLLARQPPPDPLLSWFMRQLQQRKVEEAGSEAEGLLQAAACALVVCRSLAGFAASIEGALACYEPAVSQLVDLAARLVEPAGAGGATAASIGGPPSGAARQRQVQELTALTDRTMVCLQLELLHQRLAASTLWQHWQGPAASRGVADVPSRASSTCAALVSLRLQLLARARGGAPSRQQRELLTAQAAYDLRQLAPHALAGQLARLASAPVEELAADASILALYSAMVQQEDGLPELYFTRLLGARKVAAAAEAQKHVTEAARVLAGADQIRSPAAVVDWLKAQPPSAVVIAALAAVRQGPQGLSRHLVHDCSLASLQALAAALVGRAAGGGNAGEAEEEGGMGADELLFFSDKEGNPALWGQDWAQGEEEDGGEEEGEAGIDIEALAKGASEEEGSSEESSGEESDAEEEEN